MTSPPVSFKGLRVFHSIFACHRAAFTGIILLPLLATVGCLSAIAPNVSNSATSGSATASIKITPENQTVAPGTNVQFAALVSNTGNTAVTWSASGGVITSTGLFTVPNGKAGTVFQIAATSRADSSAHAITTLAIASSPSNGGPGSGSTSIKLTPENPSAAPGAKVQFAALVSNTGNTAVTWSASGGVINSTGLFTVPNGKAGTVFQIAATSRADSSAHAITTLAIASSPSNGGSGSGSPSPTAGADNRYCNAGDIPNFGGADGPAAVPTACYQTAQDSTPSPGAVTQIYPTSKLQTAIDNATCGETLVLQARQTYPGFSLPAKNCDAGHYITIRSSAFGSGLPTEGVRATPCNAGVSSLPGRPALNCTSTSNVMARIAGVVHESQIISTAAGANYYRLVGLEIADTGANGAIGGFYDLVMLTERRPHYLRSLLDPWLTYQGKM